MHCSAFLVGGLKRAPQIFFLNFFVWVVLFGHNYGPVNQKKTHQNFSCKVGKSTSICAIDLALQHIKCTCIGWGGISDLAQSNFEQRYDNHKSRRCLPSPLIFENWFRKAFLKSNGFNVQIKQQGGHFPFSPVV